MAHVLACKRHPVHKLFAFDGDGNANLDKKSTIPLRWIERLEHNQKIASCCRHPENHDIEAFYSNESERWRDKDPDRDLPNPPDVYKFYCTCGRTHAVFCVGGGDTRPYWDVR